MSLATTDQPQAGNGAEERAISVPSRLPYPPFVFKAFGIDRGTWKALVEAVFPNASTTDSVVLALSYCRGRKLDVMKRVVHIVPIWSRELGRMVDTVWPGIGELRTTAFRTGEYAGRDASVFGPDITKQVGKVEMTFPEWGQVTVYRVIKGQRVAFAGPRVYWEETYAVKKRDDDSPNEMWQTRPRGQLDKCAEAAALRAAFPEEIGSDYIPEEVEHGPKHVESKVIEEQPRGAAALADKLKQQTDSSPPGEPVASQPAPEVATDVHEDGQADGGAGDASEESNEQMTAPEDQDRSPKSMPDHARTSEDWINDMVLKSKPHELTGRMAKTKFHALHAPKSWTALTHDEQDHFFQKLIGGQIQWQ